MDPIHQFQIVNLFPLGKLGHAEIAFTNSALFMLIAVVGLTLFLVIATAGGRAVPTRLQSAAELSYEFVASMVRSTAGQEGMRFFPFVFTIFMFVLTLNMLGLIPYGFTVTSHVVITAALALTGVLHRAHLRPDPAWIPLLQSVRAQGRADLHFADDRRHRDTVIHFAADLAQRAPVRQHAGGPHRAQGLRRLHHPARRRARRASDGSAACCPSP